VLRREYEPPIKPKVKGRGDTKHISQMFLSQELKNTPVEGTLDLDILNKMHFNDFTYSGDASEVKKAKEVDELDRYEIKVASESMKESKVEDERSPGTTSKQIEETAVQTSQS